MATHSSTIAWRIPWIEKPGGLQFTGLQRVGHNWVTSTPPNTHSIFIYHLLLWSLTIALGVREGKER